MDEDGNYDKVDEEDGKDDNVDENGTIMWTRMITMITVRGESSRRR